MATTTTVATAEQSKAVNALVNGIAVIAERESAIGVKSFDDYCDLYAEQSVVFWQAVKAMGADDADKAGPKSLTLIEQASRGKFKVESEVKGVKVKGTVSKSTVSRLRTMQHDSTTRRNAYKSLCLGEGRMPTFGPYVTYLGDVAAKRRDQRSGELTADAAKDKAAADRKAAKRAKAKVVATFDISTFVVGTDKVSKLRDLYALQHDLKAEIAAAEKGMSDKAKASARADVMKLAKRAAGETVKD